VRIDPLGCGGGDVNFYSFVQDRPSNLVDPSGETIYWHGPYFVWVETNWATGVTTMTTYPRIVTVTVGPSTVTEAVTAVWEGVTVTVSGVVDFVDVVAGFVLFPTQMYEFGPNKYGPA